MQSYSFNKKRTGAGRLIALCLTAAIILGALAGLTLGTASSAGYTDTATHWGRDAIDRWSGYGVLNGVTATRFEPDRAVTRAEFLTMINRAFGATVTTGISNFQDVSPTSWYYSEIARAVRMGTTNGTSSTTMSPNVSVSKQEAVVILARALGIYADSYDTLQTFRDAHLVAPYARTHVSAFVDLGYINGFGGYINPTAKLTRAEAVTILDNIFSDLVESSATLSASDSVLITKPGATLTGSVGGDLIIADGVGTGDITLQSLTINGRLVIRGGGSNSIKMTGVTARGGTFVQNPNGVTRLVLSGSSIGNLTARTDVIVDGAGMTALTVPSGVNGRVSATLTGAALDTVNLASPADIKLASGTVSNVYFQPGANGSTFDIASGAKVTHMSINAPNVSVTGAGTLDDVSINAAGARIAMKPKSYQIGDGLSAVINGATQYGRSAEQLVSNVSRLSSELYVTQNTAKTGGDGISMNTAASENGNSVNVYQAASTTIPLSLRSGRLAYWVGFFIPNPGELTGSVSVTYSFDGMKTTQSMTQTIQNSKRGLEIAVPVTRYEDGVLRGEFDDEIYISWGGGQYERIWLRSGPLELTKPTEAEEAALVSYFTQTTFGAYNGVTYTGAEALRRLLASDNALGLTRNGFTALAESGMTNVAVKLNGERALLTSRAKIQERLLIALAGEGAFFAINRATSAEQVKGIIELKDFGYQIGIDDAAMSKYYTLSQVGRLSVARTVLLSRGTDYKTEADLTKVFLAAVDTVRASEVKLLTDINASRTREELQKLIENKANNLLIGIVTDGDPYKSLDNDKKAYVSGTIFDKKPYISLDEIYELFISLVGIPAVPPAETVKITSVSVTNPSITIAIGDTAVIDPIVAKSTGETEKGAEGVDFTSANPAVAAVDDAGVVTGTSKGSAKVTVTSADDPTKKTTVTVNVVEPVAATGLTLQYSKLEVPKDGTRNITAKLTPDKNTSTILWNIADESIATVSATGAVATIKGVKPGMTWITASVKNEPISESCMVIVLDTERAIAVYPSSLTVGIKSTQQIIVAVSPYSLPNRGVMWQSLDPKIASVNQQGIVTGEDKGTTKVTATSRYDGNLVAECTVTVDDSIKGIILDKKEMTLYINGADVISATVVPPGGNEVVSWSGFEDFADDDPVLDADGRPINGKIMLTGTRAGTFKLVASLDNDKSGAMAECTVKVLNSSITVSMPKTLTINVGDEKLLSTNVTFTPSAITNKAITWSSDKPSIASVDPVTGRITAHSAGEVLITAVPRANVALTLTCTVTVKAIAVTSVTVPSTLTIVRGDTIELPITILPENASYTKEDIVCTYGGTDLLDVIGTKIFGKTTTFWDEETGKTDEFGNKIMVEKDHPVAVKVTVGGKSATCMVSVTKHAYTPITSIYIKMDSWVFPVGARQNMTVVINGGLNDPDLPSNSKVTWAVEGGVGYVDDNGYLVCTAPGVGKVIVTASDGVTQDTKTIVVARVGLSGLKPLTGLSADKTYGEWVGLDFGVNNRKEITAAPYDDNATDKSLIWSSQNPDIATVKLDELTKRGVVAPTASKASGWAKITIQPNQKTKYGFAVKDDDPEINMSNIIGDLPGKPKLSELANESWLYYDQNALEGRGGFYGPNKDIDGNIPYIERPNIYDVPLVVKNEIIEGAPNTNNVFYVWVGPTATPMAPNTQTFSFADAPGKNIDKGRAVTLDAALNWGSAEVKWEVYNEAGDAIVSGIEITGGDVTVGNHAIATLRGVTTGTYTIKATATRKEIKSTNGANTLQNGGALPTIEYKITVGNIDVQSIEITGATEYMTIYVGEPLTTLDVKFNPSDATHADKANIKWSTSKAAVFTVDENTGVVTPVAPDMAYVIATFTDPVTSQKRTAQLQLVVQKRPDLTGVTITGTDATTRAFTLTAVPVPADALITVEAEWKAADVSGTGVLAITPTLENPMVLSVYALKAGTSDITVTLNKGKPDEKSTTRRVTVTESGGVYTVAITMPAGTFSAGTQSVGASTTLPPTQTAPLEAVKLRSSATAVAGKTLTLQPFVSPYNATQAGLTWSSSNTAVATVENGVVTAVKSGSAKITVASEDGKLKSTCTVTVRATDDKPVTSISISKKTLTLNAGSSSTLTVSYKPSNATVKGVAWRSSDETVARVDPAGKVTGVSGGKVTITAVSDSGGFSATCEVTVKVPVKSVKLSDTTLKLKVGETYKLGLTINPDNATNQTAAWKSGASSIVSVSSDGTLTARKAGTATITVTVDGKKATCKVTVVK